MRERILNSLGPIACMLMIAIIAISIATGQQNVIAPPSWERIERKGDTLILEDKETRVIHLRCSQVSGATRWYPGKHPEQRPFDAIELRLGSALFRLDCEKSADADRILELLFEGKP